ncbi:uncharacterized protein Tco025E_06268 [Trypanosoma conorhini]|uniref:Uncharacterized protein n=1 Tax=Trypanosoma conorhini TaxID=83891 RepID=A0A422P6A6_9TRYP|nr:uncharacterized protein Tco025E_06268 [Trypanosoma conorhini]RNF13248.1 hypothetical protein Tco025E_06268 [Trypanosoma conorhini]
MHTGTSSAKRGVRCGSRRGLWVLLAVVLFACIALDAATLAAAEGAPKYSAAPAHMSCAEGVRAYLLQTLTRRAGVEALVARARAELNELRSILEEERSGQRRPSSDTQTRLKAAWAEFESASAAARKFDESVMKSHGSLPHTCIREVNALSAADPDAEDFVGRTKYLLENAILHLRLYGETLRGVVLFNVAEYKSAVDFYKEVVRSFNAKAQKAYDELQLRKRNRSFEEEKGGLWELAEFALMYARAASLALVPWATLFSMCVLLFLFAPFLLAAVVIPQLVWRVWLQLFFLHHTYGLTVDGLLLSLRQYLDLVVQKDWAGLQERCVTAVLDLAAPDNELGTFFNGILAAALVLTSALLVLMLIYYWVRLPYAIIAPEVELWRNRNALRQLQKEMAKPASSSPAPTAATTANEGNESKAPAQAAAAARGTKKADRDKQEGGGSGSSSSSLEKSRRKKKA